MIFCERLNVICTSIGKSMRVDTVVKIGLFRVRYARINNETSSNCMRVKVFSLSVHLRDYWQSPLGNFHGIKEEFLSKWKLEIQLQ